MSTNSSLVGNYSSPSPPSGDELQYGDSTSSTYRERLIRPLPKRRLRSLIPPEVADSILFPERTISSAVPTQIAGINEEAFLKNSGNASDHYPSEHRVSQLNDSYQFRGSGLDEGVVNGVRHRNIATGSTLGRTAYLATRQDDPRFYRQTHMPPPIPPSAASSADSIDGYDSFENTNNKKKRKIPISGSLSHHQSSLSADMAHMDISSTRKVYGSSGDPDDGVGQYYGSGSSAIAASTYGSGGLSSNKTRSGRSGMRRPSGRSPLGVSFNGPNASLGSRSMTSFNKDEGSVLESLLKSNAAVKKPSNQGIISAAIANAAAMPSTPSRGQEEVSLLDQKLLKKPSSSKTQFTFVCESDSAKSMTWPGYGYASTSGVHGMRSGTRGGSQVLNKPTTAFSTQGTQTSPSMGDQSDQLATQGSDSQAPLPPRKPRRSLTKQLALAARDRKLKHDFESFRNPPKPDKVWVCDFCEYEMIFGEPPAALIRRYEMKDRSERKRLAEKRRLLEKAKMKNRKGKKGSKNKNQATAQPQQQNQKTRHDTTGNDHGAAQSQDTQSDEQLLDEYDEDIYSPQPGAQDQPILKNSQPMAQAKNHLVRPPAGIGIGSEGGPNRAA